MKKYLFLLFFPITLFIGCGDSETSNNDNNNADSTVSSSATLNLDLSEYGLPLTIMYPDIKSMQGKTIPPTVEAFPDDFFWEIIIGDHFHIQIEDTGDEGVTMDAVKQEHSQDMVFTYETIIENDNDLLYKKSLPSDAGKDPYFHIIVLKKINGANYTITSDDMGEFNQGQAKKMFDAAITLSTKVPA